MNDQAERPIGIVVSGGVIRAQIFRNLVGTDGAGNQLVVNGQPYSQRHTDGIVVSALDPTETTSNALIKDNIVGGMRFGIVAQGPGVSNTIIQGNNVGVSKDRASKVPNVVFGILVTREDAIPSSATGSRIRPSQRATQ